MEYLNKFANIRLALIFCSLCVLALAAFWNVETSAQQQTQANSNSAPAASPASPTPTASPTPILPSLIIAEKEKTEKRLDDINQKISEQSPVVRIEAELSQLVEDSEARDQQTNEALDADGSASLETLDKIEDYWTLNSLSFPSLKTRLQTRAAEIEAQLIELQNANQIWSLTAQSLQTASAPTGNEAVSESLSGNAANTDTNRPATAATNANRNAKAETNANFNRSANTNSNSNANAAIVNAPATTVPNQILPELPENLKIEIAEILDRIRQTQTAAQTNLGELIKLQERIAQNEKRTNEILGKIAAARNVLLSNLVVRDYPPIWSQESFEPGFRQAGNKSFQAEFAELREYAGENRNVFLFHLLVFVVLIWAFRRARGRTRQFVAAEPQLAPGLTIFESPVVSALILSALFGVFFYSDAPELFGVIASPILVVAIFILFRRLVEKRHVPVLIAIVALYLVNDLRLLTEPIPLLSRLIFLAMMLAGIVFLAWLIFSGGRAENSAPANSDHSGISRKISFFLLIPFAVAFFANAFGYVGLAGVVGKTIVASLSFGLILYALVKVADSLLIFAFHIPPLARLGMVGNHRELVQAKFFRVVKWLAILFWLAVSLSEAYLLIPFFGLLRKILTYEAGVGEIAVSLGAVLLFVFVIWFSFLLSRFLRFALAEDVYPRVNMASGLPYATSTILHYVLLLGGVFLALAAVGIDLTKFTIFLGALGVGVGIGLQNIVENFVSGLILLLERPVKVGDSIEMRENHGELKAIGLRASIVQTFDGAEIIVPNGQLVTEAVTNWTLTDHRRRLDINVGVEYGSDPENVIRLLEAVAVNHPEIDTEFAPRALFLGFGENSLDFQLRAWTANYANLGFIKSELTVGIYKKLKEADIQIPFPQRDLHIKSVDGELLTSINQIQSKKSENSMK